MDGIVGVALMIVFAAAMCEGAIEFVVMPFLDTLKGHISETVRIGIVQLISAVAGVAIAYTFDLGLFCWLAGVAGVGFSERLAGSDNLLTGIAIGRGSNYVHLLVKRFIVSTEEKQARIDALARAP